MVARWVVALIRLPAGVLLLPIFGETDHLRATSLNK